MENKINVAELLKDCPKGMELDCIICNGVKFIELDRNPNFPIVVRANNDYEFTLTKYGQVHNINDAKCVIFPKGKTTWEGFQRPFKDGDILAYNSTVGTTIFIHRNKNGEHAYKTSFYVGLNGRDKLLVYDKYGLIALNGDCDTRLATEEEKAKLFQTIKANGYRWNAETKTLEKLIIPKFKVGDRIKAFYNVHQYVIKAISDNHYTLEEVEGKSQYTEPIVEDKNWTLVPNKFDITTLKAFDKVLVRDSDIDMWCASIFSHTWNNKYFCIGGWHNQCIPYEVNKDLRGTTNDCDEYYKTWEQ